MNVIIQFLITLLVTTIIWALLKWYSSRVGLPKGLRYPPHFVPFIPILGSFPFMPRNMMDLPNFLTQQATKYGDVLAFYMGPKYAVVLNSAETMTEALVKKSAHFSDRGESVLSTVISVPDKGIALSNYTEAFRRQHKLTLSILRKFGYGNRSMESRIIVEAEELLRQIRLTDGKLFNPNDMLNMCVLNVIASLLFGRRYPYGHPTLLKLRRSIRDSSGRVSLAIELFPILRYVPPFRGQLRDVVENNDLLISILNQEVNTVLKDASAGDQTDSFARQFVEATATDLDKSSLADASFDRLELLYVMRDLIVAGDDTSSATMCWLILRLANHPDIQTRLQREIDDVVGRDRMCSLDDEVKMPYTQALILETMRHDAINPLGVFHETSSDTSVGDFFIPAKTNVIMNRHKPHMDPTRWSQPEVFNPERFLDENGQITGKKNLVTFSMGKRSCIGEILARQELFLFITGIAQNFDIRPPEGQSKVTCSIQFSIVLLPADLQIRMTPRQRSA